jgi:hypothetical protein
LKVKLQPILKTVTLIVVFATIGAAISAAGQSHARRTKRASICGNPLVACKSSVDFQPYDLPFGVPRNAVIWDTNPFYAIILKSEKVENDNCDRFISEDERLAAQALFPDHKVFTSRCVEPGNLFYEDVTKSKSVYLTDGHVFMAVYAGATLPEAKRFLEKVNASGKFPGANLRRLRTGFNGT